MAATKLGMTLNRQTDVIVLNAASIETAYQAVTTGIRESASYNNRPLSSL
jgi:hypothetical protein